MFSETIGLALVIGIMLLLGMIIGGAIFILAYNQGKRDKRDK